MKTRSSLLMFAVAFAAVIAPQHIQAQTTYLPFIVDGGNWYTAIMINNTSVAAALVNLTFFQDTTTPRGATIPWNPPFAEVSSTNNISVPPGGVVYIHTNGTAAALTEGWAQVTKSQASVEVTAIYTYESFAGRPNQDGTSPATAGGSRILVPFDTTSGYSTGLAIVNPTGGSEFITINAQTDSGSVTNGQMTLPANGQLAFDVGSQFPTIAGHRGEIEFVSDGTLAVAAFRINPTVALTSIPVTETSGSAIIGATTTTILPQFTVIKMNFSTDVPCPIALGCLGHVFIYKSTITSGYAGAVLNLTANYKAQTLNVIAGFSNIAQNGLQLVLSNIPSDGFSFVTNSSLSNTGNITISVGTVQLDFTPRTDNPASGSVTATFKIPDFSGPFSVQGSYSAQ